MILIFLESKENKVSESCIFSILLAQRRVFLKSGGENSRDSRQLSLLLLIEPIENITKCFDDAAIVLQIFFLVLELKI